MTMLSLTLAVFGLSTNDEQARHIVDRLLSSGFSNEDISILYPDRNKDKIRTNELDFAQWSNLR